MELKTIYGDVIIALDTAKTFMDLVLYAIAAKTSLSGANLSGAYLRDADLSRANLSRANLSGANLSRANLSGWQFIPPTGCFIGWKKCRDNVIVRLMIGRTAQRSHGTERKCRASCVKVMEVIGAEVGVSLHDASVEYRVGQIVRPVNGWDENRWNTCAPGIHFYLTREEAEAHG
jgi:hypothetical protein